MTSTTPDIFVGRKLRSGIKYQDLSEVASLFLKDQKRWVCEEVLRRMPTRRVPSADAMRKVLSLHLNSAPIAYCYTAEKVSVIFRSSGSSESVVEEVVVDIANSTSLRNAVHTISMMYNIHTTFIFAWLEEFVNNQLDV